MFALVVAAIAVAAAAAAATPAVLLFFSAIVVGVIAVIRRRRAVASSLFHSNVLYSDSLCPLSDSLFFYKRHFKVQIEQRALLLSSTAIIGISHTVHICLSTA